MSPDMLFRTANRLLMSYPEVDLMKNNVGNLAIIDQVGDYIGYVDMRTGEIHILGEVGEEDYRNG